MFRNLRTLAVIPARGGSKGIPLKNIVPLAGKELLRYTTEFSSSLQWLDRCVVSTDHSRIAEVAREAEGIEIVWRPEELSGDRVGDIDVVRHAVIESERMFSEVFDLVVMLQPTSPLRTEAHLLACIDVLIDGMWDAVWTLSETPLSYHPLKQISRKPNGQICFYEEGGEQIVARQQLAPVFHRNGICYAMRRHTLESAGSLYLESRTAGIFVQEPHVSIDTLEDVRAVEAILESMRGDLGNLGPFH